MQKWIRDRLLELSASGRLGQRVSGTTTQSFGAAREPIAREPIDGEPIDGPRSSASRHPATRETHMTTDPTARHSIERFRQEPRRRTLVVDRIENLGPRMRRIEFTSPDLTDFDSRSPDDHIKIFVADPDAGGEIVMRDYTPRRFDRAARRLTIDFALHETGPVTSWARNAKIGDRLDIGGPRGSMTVADDFDWYLLVGDETALPSIGRRLEGLRAGVPVTSIVVVDGPQDVQIFETAAVHQPVWVFRRDLPDLSPGTPVDRDASALLAAVKAWSAPDGEGYVWIAAEAGVARTLRDHMLKERQHPKAWLKAAGYWVAGAAGTSDKMDR